MNRLLIDEEMSLYMGGLLIILGVLGLIRLIWRKYHGSMERKRWNRWLAVSIFCILFGLLELVIKIFEGTCCILNGTLLIYAQYREPKIYNKLNPWREKRLRFWSYVYGATLVIWGLCIVYSKICLLCGIRN